MRRVERIMAKLDRDRWKENQIEQEGKERKRMRTINAGSMEEEKRGKKGILLDVLHINRYY